MWFRRIHPSKLQSRTGLHGSGTQKGENFAKTSEIFRKVRLGAAVSTSTCSLYEVFQDKTTKLASAVANWTIIGGCSFLPQN